MWRCGMKKSRKIGHLARERTSVASRMARRSPMNPAFLSRPEPPRLLTRRLFLAAAALPLASSALASPSPAPRGLLVPTAPLMVPPPVPQNPLLSRARAELARLGGAIPHHDLVAIADFASPSKAPRFHLVDMATGTVDSLLVSHGSGSDPANSGWLKAFSNQPGSNASCEGAFRTAEFYTGKHGRSMRLDGLDEANSNARDRAIVIHGAWYVSAAMAAAAGRIGRSQGCFAFSEGDLPKVMERLGPGRLLFSTRL